MNLSTIFTTLISISATAAQTTTTTTTTTTIEAKDDKFTITCDYRNRFPLCSNEGRLDVLLNDESSSISTKSKLYIKTVQTQPSNGYGHCDIGDRRSSSDNREVVVYTPGSTVKVANEIICEYTVCIINTMNCDTAKIYIRLQEQQLIQ